MTIPPEHRTGEERRASAEPGTDQEIHVHHEGHAAHHEGHAHDDREPLRYRPPMLGEPFPRIEGVQTTTGELTLPDDYAGDWFVLFSHPGDFTPVCTTEFVGFERLREEFEDLGVHLVGLSVDRVHAHIKWLEWIEDELGVEVGFPVIADETGRVAERLGMLHPAMGSTTVRSVFVVDPAGTLRLLLHYPMEVGRDVTEILRGVRALQTSDAEGVVIPERWPDNEDLADRVLLKPPSDVESAEARLEEADAEGYECADWWYCHRELSE